jgi:hypothetical protein
MRCAARSQAMARARDILKQQDASVSNRIDHIDARMERIARRTGLVETT